MIENIFEKVLLSNVGHYIDGVDKNNLKVGIWSGEIVIQNISVRSEVFEMLDLPLKMVYSSVGKLAVNVPWKSLGSKPLELTLEDVFIILEPINQECWKEMDYKSVTKRLELMERFIQSFMAQIAKKRAQENKDAKNEEQGMFSKLVEKVIDNIQVTVRNIHIRFENPLIKRKYAWGATLEEMLLYTTNDKWEKEFVDRTESKNSLEPLRKMLCLKNLGVYWNSSVSELFAHLAPKYIIENMKGLILNEKMDQKQKMAYIIGISATCKLKQKNKKDPATAQDPEFDVGLNLKPINIQLNKFQLEDVIQLLEFFNSFERFKLACMLEREKEIEKMNPEEKEQMRQEFKRLFTLIQSNENVQSLKIEEKLIAAFESQEEVERFKNIVMCVNDQDLAVIIKEVIKEVERERRKKALEANKAASFEQGNSWFSWGSKKKEELKNSELLKLDTQDIEALDKYIQEIFSEEDDAATKMKKLAYQNLFSISFTLEGGNFYLSNLAASGDEEGVTLSYQNLSAKIDVNSKGQRVKITLKDYGLYLRTRYKGTNNYIDTPIIRRINYWMPLGDDENIVDLNFEQNPQGKEDGLYLILDSKAVEIVLRPLVIERLISFFDVSTQDESLKSQAWEQIAKAQDKASSTASVVAQTVGKKDILINVAAPVIVIPFLQNGDAKSECWVVNLGHLVVRTEEEKTNLYDRVVLGLNNFTFQYYPSQLLYMKVFKSLKEKGDLSLLSGEENQEYQKIFNLIEYFNINIELEKMLNGRETLEIAKGKSNLNLSITIPTINIQLNPKIYRNLLRTGEFISYSKENAMELMDEDRTKLIVGNLKLGSVFIQETKIKDIVWSKYLCIFKGAYLHFFKNPTDPRPAFSYYIRGANIILKDNLDKPYAFMVENRYNTGFIACDNEKQRHEWVTLLKQKVKEYAVVSTNLFEANQPTTVNIDEKPSKPVDYDLLEIKVVFQIKQVNLTVFHKENFKLFHLCIKNFLADFRKHPAQIAIKLKLEALDITDYLIEYKDPNLEKLVTSKLSELSVEQQNTELIEIDMKILDKDHPDYSVARTDLEVLAKFGYLFVNFKPFTIQQTMKFFLQPLAQKPEAPQNQQSEVQNNDIVYTQGTEHTMIKLNVELKEFSVKVIHARTHIQMAEGSLKNSKLSLRMKPLVMEVSGVLGNFQLFDTTNYPFTLSSPEDYEKIQPYELIGVQDNKNIIEFEYRSLESNHPQADHENSIYSYADVIISSVRVNYLQQPILRLLDYLTGQLLPALNPAENLEGIIRARTLIKLEKSLAQQTVSRPQFMDIKVSIDNPIVIVKPIPTSTEYMEIKLGNILINNERVKDASRFKDSSSPLEFVYCERYNLKLSNMGMYRIQGEFRLDMSLSVNFDFSFERLLFEEEYNVVYGSPQKRFTLDNSMRLEGKMSPIIIMLMHEDFLMIMKCLNFNITYDDLLDARYVSDYRTASSIEIQPGTRLCVDLQFENFTLLAFGRNHLPFAMINLHLMDISVARDEVRNMEIQISSREINGSYFENQGHAILLERKMLGVLDYVNSFFIIGVHKMQVTEQIFNATTSHVRQIAEMHASKGVKKDQIIIKIQMRNTGDKIIKATINDLKAYLVTKAFLKLLEFITMNDSIYPPQPQQENTQVPPPSEGFLTLTLDVKNILVLIPSTQPNDEESPPNVLVLRGDISAALANYALPSFGDSLADINGKKFRRATEQCAQFNEVGRINLTIPHLELFSCESAGVMSDKNFNKVKKRNIILPFSLILVRKTFMVLNKERTDLIPISKTEICIERLIVRLSYQDVILVNNSLQFQLEQLGSFEKTSETNLQQNTIKSDKKEILEETKEDPRSNNDNNLTENNDQAQEDWLSNLEEYHFVSKGIQIVLINDSEGSLVPVLEFTVFELFSSMLMVTDKLKASGMLSISCSYFNPLPSTWSPLIERFGLDYELKMQESPKIEMNISTSEGYEDININISDQLLEILSSISKTWGNEYHHQKSLRQNQNTTVLRLTSKIREEEVIDYVSPYTIINDTGYAIEVSADAVDKPEHIEKKKVRSGRIKQKYLIQNGGSAQYLVESEITKVFERTMQEMMINRNKIKVKILHPTLLLNEITGIDIDDPSIEEHILTEENEQSSKITDMHIFTMIKVDQTKKMIVLSSPIRIKNTISKLCCIILEALEKKVEINLDTDESFAIPFEFLDGQFSIRISNEKSQSQKMPVNDFFSSSNKMIEISTGSSFVLARIDQPSPSYGFFEVTLLPSFEIKNCCGLELYYRFVENNDNIIDISRLKPQEVLHETKLTRKKAAYLQLRLQGYYWSEKFLVHSPDPNVKISNKVCVQDARNNLLNILIFIPDGDDNKKLFLYTKTCIVNETPYDLVFYKVEDKKKIKIPGQLPTDKYDDYNQKVLLFNEITKMVLLKKDQNETSQTVNVGTMGSTAVELVKENGTSMLDLGVNMSLLRCDKDYNLITKIITMSPRFVMLNKTEYTIQIKREQGNEILLTLEKDVRKPFYWSEWSAANKDKSIATRLLEHDKDIEFWTWSNGFNINSVGSYNYLIQSKDRTQSKFLKAIVELDYSTIFIIFEEEKVEKPAFKIRNACPHLTIVVHQAGCDKNSGITLKPKEVIPWSWVYPNKKKEVSAYFVLESVSENASPSFIISFDSVNTVSTTEIEVDKDRKIEVSASIAVEGSTRVLKFFIPPPKKLDVMAALFMVGEYLQELKKAPPEIINLKVEVGIKGVGISLVSNLTVNKEKRQKERREFLYILFKQIEFIMIDSTQTKSSQLRVKYMNIDNNTAYETSFPVLLTPTKPKLLINPTTKNYFLDALVTQKVTPEFTYFETVQFLLDASTIKIDGMFIDAMIEMASNFIKILDSTEHAAETRTIAQNLYNSLEDAKKLEKTHYLESRFGWKTADLSDYAGETLYIKKLVLNPLLFNISFQLKKKDASEDTFFIINLLTSVLGTAIANLDDVHLILNGKRSLEKIVGKYKSEVTKSIPKVLGSLDIVGNPVGLFTNISTGVVDFVEKPIEGFLHGPLEGGKGIVKGAGSLMKHTVSGTFNSIGKVTGSLASGLSNLTMDDEYIAHRQKAKMKRPKNLGEGILKGVTSLVVGVGEGVTGVIMKPIKGASKGGVKGFFKGTVQGVTGLVVKPVTGVLDAASNTAEGIKNTATFFDEKPNEIRMRYPRVFYGKEKFYRTYVDTDAEIQWLLRFSKERQYRQISLISSFDICPDENEKGNFYILAISLEAIIYWCVKKRRIVWAVKTTNINKATQIADGIIIQLQKATEIFKDKTVHIQSCDQALNKFICKKLNELKIAL